ncbi:MAG: DUF2202 domain-containing protein [Chloroflexota bacterium]
MIHKQFWALSLIIILILALAACGSAPAVEEPAPVMEAVEPVQDVVVEPTVMPVVAAPLPEVKEMEATEGETAVLPSVTSSTLTDTEIEALQFMREEEKLARDVYLVLYDQWGLPIFQNIADSEQMHMDTILGLMQRYDLADSAANLGPGQFANADLQALYNQLSASGGQSLAEALRVGALIEETDIADLESRLAAIQNGEIAQAFNNLRQGSLNHLRAYATMLERQTGEVYQPQVLDDVAYAAVLSGTSNGYGSQGQGQGNPDGQGNVSGRGNGGNGQGANRQGNGRS